MGTPPGLNGATWIDAGIQNGRFWQAEVNAVDNYLTNTIHMTAYNEVFECALPKRTKEMYRYRRGEFRGQQKTFSVNPQNGVEKYNQLVKILQKNEVVAAS